MNNTERVYAYIFEQFQTAYKNQKTNVYISVENIRRHFNYEVAPAIIYQALERFRRDFFKMLADTVLNVKTKLNFPMANLDKNLLFAVNNLNIEEGVNFFTAQRIGRAQIRARFNGNETTNNTDNLCEVYSADNDLPNALGFEFAAHSADNDLPNALGFEFAAQIPEDMPSDEFIRENIHQFASRVRVFILREAIIAQRQGRKTITLRAGDLQNELLRREIQNAPNQPATICNAMYDIKEDILGGEIIETPPAGHGTNLRIQFYLANNIQDRLQNNAARVQYRGYLDIFNF